MDQLPLSSARLVRFEGTDLEDYMTLELTVPLTWAEILTYVEIHLPGWEVVSAGVRTDPDEQDYIDKWEAE